MREGAAALGVWLPLALADLVGAVVELTRGRQLRRDEILAAWCLPNLARAVKADEERREEDELESGLSWLEENFARK